ncbi:MAG: amidohydrolase [Acidimicrobiales bacterium]|nr:amidohydrolase [Acidimicrobiales bacterium]
MASFVRSDEVARIRTKLGHPVIDSDGHLIEFTPVVRDFIVDIAGEDVAKRFDVLVDHGRIVRQVPPGEERRKLGLSRSAWWGLPTRNTLDRATAMLPGLLYDRLDEIGIDVAVVYPTYGLTVTALPDDELRQAMARACNRYYAEAFADYSDRLVPVAAIPMFTPDEAVAEIDHAVGELGLKAVMLSGVIPRAVAGAEAVRGARWVDTPGHDSPFDYDPVWAACQSRDVAATFHASGMGWGSRASTSNYVFNHIGNFAAAGEATARALFFGGVPRRFPELRFAFQEGGVAWACNLLSDILGHFAKRNRGAIGNYDPAELDRARLGALFDEFATGPLKGQGSRLADGLNMLSEPDADPDDEFAAALIDGAADVIDVFTRQYHFGCEADDPMNAIAFATKLNPHGARLRAVFASDIGHWDVPDVREVLVEAHELVDHGHLSDEDFRDFVFTNPRSLWGRAFFEGTIVGAGADP